MRKLVYLTLFICAISGLKAQPSIAFTSWITGIRKPVCVSHCNDERVFIVSQLGKIFVTDTSGVTIDTFLDITSKVLSSGNEQGLLSVAFHPEYATNGFFFVDYTRKPDGATVISKFHVSAARNKADTAETILKVIAQPYTNHNGGCVKFGPDGYLYIGMGDGGSGGDPGNRAQNPKEYLGKMLRIDVNSGSPYGIPPGNPWATDTSHYPELWAMGMRNPWRYSFDRLTGDLWIGDVGQNIYEEIDFEPAGTPGGRNYGWRCYEGNNVYDTSAGCPGSYTRPVATYTHGSGRCSVTGGYVYRGAQFKDLYGWYFYADYCPGTMYALRPDGAGGWTNPTLSTSFPGTPVAFGEDKWGELYACQHSTTTTGAIYKMSSTICDPVALVSPDSNEIEYCRAGTLRAQEGRSLAYQWKRDGIDIPTATTSSYTPVSADAGHIIQVEVIKSSTCKTMSDSVKILPCTGIQSLNEQATVLIFPNPAKDKLNIELVGADAGNALIKLFNATGELVYSEQSDISSGVYRHAIDIHSFNNGLYILEVSRNGKEISHGKFNILK